MTPSQYSRPKSSIYTPLDKTTRSIRLLCFTETPPNSVDTLHFTLTVHNLPTEEEQTRQDDQCIKYIALSYVWGESEPDCSVNINGERVHIRENLYDLLQALHTKSQAANGRRTAASSCALSELLRERPYLWADAICIDQEAVEEKGHQVNMMGDIYLRAVCVVAWLGPAGDESDLAIDDWRNADDWEYEKLTDSSHGVNAQLALLNRSYWQRLWIVQEMALARKRFLLCGQSVVSLHGTRGEEITEAIRSWIEWASEGGLTEAEQILDIERATGAKQILRAGDYVGKNPEEFDFHHIVHRYKMLGCQNRHDRIFALLAIYQRSMLTWKSDIPIITADYKATPERLFYSVLAHCSISCIMGKKGVAESEMQDVLNVPHCKVETWLDAFHFVDDVSGRQDVWSLDEEEIDRALDLTIAQLIQEGIVRERSVEEVMGHLKRLTGLTTENILEDPEGTYLEVVGRLYNHPKWNPQKDPNLDGHQYSDTWETFTNVLRRTLGMPVIDYSIC